jgi:GNAT superfamily N-acetyltransferase
MDIVRQLEANYFAYIRSMALEHRQEEGLEWVYTGVAIENRVFNAQLQPKALDGQILSVLQRFARWDVAVNWDIGPASQPIKLNRDLERFGFNKRSALTGMVLELPGLQPQPSSPGLSLQGVDQTNLGIWSKTVGLASEWPKTRIGMFQKIYQRTLTQPQWRHFLVYQGQETVGACSLLEAGGMLGLYWLAILPRFRKRGLATAALARLLKAEQDKHTHAVLLAPQPGSELFRRLGFAEACGIEVYQCKPV